MKGDAQLHAMLEKLRKLESMPVDAAPKCAVAVRDALRSTIAEGTDAYGQAWQLTRDGKKPLATADASLRVTSIGSRVFAAITGHISRHNYGAVKGGIERRVLPRKAIPADMSKRIAKALSAVFDGIVQGGR